MAILVQHNFTAGFAPSTEASGVTGTTIVGTNLNALANENLGYASDPVLRGNPADGSTTAALAITNDQYISFSITPTGGNSIDLTSLDFEIARGGGTTPRGYDVRSSDDSYAVTLGTADITTARTTFSSVSIDLTGAAFQGLTTTTTFRIYIYSPSSAFSVDIDDLTLNGSVAASGTVEQEGFIFRADDGSESTATNLAAQDTNIIQPIETNTRLRVLLNGTLDRGIENYRLEYRKVGDPSWTVIN